jgi:hypothetical protein
MDDFTDFEHLIPPEESTGATFARHRLRAAVTAERRRARREWFFVRSVLVGTVIFTVWSIAQTTPNTHDVPLVGLAEATAQLVPPEIGPGDEWYVREERSEWVSLSDRSVPSPTDVSVLVSTVAETWIDPGASTIRQSTVSQVESLSPDDRRARELVERSEQLPIGRFESDPVEITYPGVHPIWSGGAESVLAELASLAGENDDVRLDRLAILKSASDMMQMHGSDPVKRATLLLAIARIPGIEVDLVEELLSVRFRYANGDLAQEVRYDFDRTDGALVGESIVTLATPTSPEFVLSHSKFEAGLAVDEPAGS